MAQMASIEAGSMGAIGRKPSSSSLFSAPRKKSAAPLQYRKNNSMKVLSITEVMEPSSTHLSATDGTDKRKLSSRSSQSGRPLEIHFEEHSTDSMTNLIGLVLAVIIGLVGNIPVRVSSFLPYFSILFLRVSKTATIHKST